MTINECHSYMSGLDSERIIEYILTHCKGAESFIKGSCVEMGFIKVVESFGWVAKKVDDQDRSRRYDFLIQGGEKSLRFEVKTLSSNKTAHIGYKDSRSVVLPSGQVWVTKARRVTESFDFLALSLTNYGGKNTDFVCVNFDSLPRLKVKNLKKFTVEDRDWIKENYISLSIKLNSLEPLDERFKCLSKIIC